LLNFVLIKIGDIYQRYTHLPN